MNYPSLISKADWIREEKKDADCTSVGTWLNVIATFESEGRFSKTGVCQHPSFSRIYMGIIKLLRLSTITPKAKL